MVKLAFTAVVALAFAGTAVGSGEPTFKLKPGYTSASALAKVERTVSRTAGFSGAGCWMSDGTARGGWRHGNCVGNYNYVGTTYWFRVTYGPLVRAVLGPPSPATLVVRMVAFLFHYRDTIREAAGAMSEDTTSVTSRRVAWAPPVCPLPDHRRSRTESSRADTDFVSQANFTLQMRKLDG